MIELQLPRKNKAECCSKLQKKIAKLNAHIYNFMKAFKNFLKQMVGTYFGALCHNYSVNYNPFLKRKLNLLVFFIYSKPCLKRPLKNRQNKGRKDKW